MSAGSTAKGLLPVHLKPKDDELLSSWLARLASAHGLAPNTFCSLMWPKHHVTKDIDLTEDLKILNLLAQGVGTSINSVVATTLSEYKDRLYESGEYEPFPWILPVDTIPRNRVFGLQFCPQCLSDDKKPYFRRRWRLAFVTLCEKHLTPLLDSCSHCGSCITNLARRNTFQQIQMLDCPSCNSDLRTATLDSSGGRVDLVEVKFQEYLVRGLHQGWVEIPGNDPVYSLLYFKVLYTLLNQLSIDMFSKSLRAHVSWHFNISQAIVTLPERDPSFEKLHTDARRGVLGMARHMLEDWPNRFISFWASQRLSNYHAFARYLSTDGNQNAIPFWCWSVLHDFVIEPDYIGWYEMYAVDMERDKRGSQPKRSAFLALGLANIGSKDLTNRQWSLIRPLIPELTNSSGYHGPPRRDSREVLNGILWKFRTGSRWQYMPKRFPSHQTCFRRFQQWLHDGTLSKVLETLVEDLEKHCGVELSKSSTDSMRTEMESEGLLWVLLCKAKARSSWFWQTLIIFLSPSTRSLLLDMNSPLYQKLNGRGPTDHQNG